MVSQQALTAPRHDWLLWILLFFFFLTRLYVAVLVTFPPVFKSPQHLIQFTRLIFTRVSLSSSRNFQLSWDFLCFFASNPVLFTIKSVHWLYSWSSDYFLFCFIQLFIYLFFFTYQLLSNVPSILIHTSIVQMYHFSSKGSVYVFFFTVSDTDSTMKYSQGYTQCYLFKNPNLGLFFFYL